MSEENPTDEHAPTPGSGWKVLSERVSKQFPYQDINNRIFYLLKGRRIWDEKRDRKKVPY